MATVGSYPIPTNTVDSISSTNSSSNKNSSSVSSTSSSLANESTFLQLLVAQLQNQDPMQPQDGTQFVTQLADFTNLEQNLAIRGDMDAIKSKYVGSSAGSSTTSGSTSIV